MSVRQIKPTIHYLKARINQQFGFFTGAGHVELGVKKRVKLDLVDTALNFVARTEIAYLRLLNFYASVAGKPKEFEKLPLEKTRIKLGEVRRTMKISSIDEQALNHLPDSVCYISPEGRIFWANQTLFETLGYHSGDVIGKSFESFILPEDLSLARERFGSLLKTRESNPSELRILKKDGGFIWGWVKGRVLIEREKVLGVALLIRDITERREKELKKIINERINFLRDIWQGLNHEFNNAFQGILPVIENLRFFSSLGPEKFEELVKNVERNAKRLTAFSNRLRYLASFTGSAKVRGDLGGLVEEVLTLMRGKLNEADIEVIRNFPMVFDEGSQSFRPRPVVLSMHFLGIQTMFIDLLNNAIEAIMVRRSYDPFAPRRIVVILDIDETNGKRQVVLAIKDTGCGINSADLEKVFDPFFTTKPSAKGSGLGLSIVQQIVREHSGTVSISSKVDQGTTVLVRFPLGE